MASTNVHQVADISVDARLISAFQNGALWKVDPNLPGGAALESRGAELVVPSSPPRRDAPTRQPAKNLEQRSEDRCSRRSSESSGALRRLARSVLSVRVFGNTVATHRPSN